MNEKRETCIAAILARGLERVRKRSGRNAARVNPSHSNETSLTETPAGSPNVTRTAIEKEPSHEQSN